MEATKREVTIHSRLGNWINGAGSGPTALSAVSLGAGVVPASLGLGLRIKGWPGYQRSLTLQGLCHLQSTLISLSFLQQPIRKAGKGSTCILQINL